MPRPVVFRDRGLVRQYSFRDADFLTVERLGPMQSLSPEGFLIIRNVPLARTGPQLYSDQEIPIKGGADGRIVIDRLPDEVFRPATIASLNGKAVTLDHPDDDVMPENWKELMVGVVMEPRRGLNALDNLLIGDLMIYDPAAIKAIRSRQVREVSVGYKADYEETGLGRGKQRNIICNHLALVQDGRCGPICRIGDKAFYPRHEADCGCGACSTHDEWKEGDPRRDNGQFGSGGGGGRATKSEGSSAERAAPPAEKAGKPTSYKHADFEQAGFKFTALDQQHHAAFAEHYNKYVKTDPAAFKARLTGGLEGTLEIERAAGNKWIEYVEGGKETPGDQGGWVYHGLLGGERKSDAIGEYGYLFDPEKKEGEFVLCTLRKAEQGKGHAKRMLTQAIEQIKEMGIEKVNIHADMDMGGYSWARYGWVPSQKAWVGPGNLKPGDYPDHGLRAEIEHRIGNYDYYNKGKMSAEEKALFYKLVKSDDPKKVWILADSKFGKNLLYDMDWRGALDMNDPQAVQRLNSYLKGEGKKDSVPISSHLTGGGTYHT
jgi:GNAT superfamily N-acetyltransferase